MRTLVVGGLAAMAASGCVTPEAEVPTREAAGSVCQAEGLGAMVGRAATRQLGTDALRMSGARLVRWITPGSVVTMDFRPDRLNIVLDAGNRVTAFHCG